MASPILTPIRPGAYAVVRLVDGRIVLTKKSRWPYTGKYDLPGGGIEHGEDHRAAVIRELVEEIGLVAKLPKLLDVFHSVVEFDTNEERYRNHLIGIVFVVDGIFEDDMLPELRAEDDDVADVVILTLSEALALNLTPIAKQALMRFALNQKRV